MNWLVDTMLWSITPIRGFDMGGSTIFLSWLKFSASPALSPSCENASLLSWGQVQRQGKPLEDVVVAGDHLVLGARPPLRSLLWLKL
jgi:hypothetical protein